MEDNSPINIVEEMWYSLSPFSAHSISMWGKDFATVEHAYQFARFIDMEVKGMIKNATSPLEAWRIAQKYKNNPELLSP